MIDETFDGVPDGAGVLAAFPGGGTEALELKADEPAALAAMAGLLTRMRGELDQQFQTFASLRDGAMRRAGEEQPEAEAKLARADLKAAVEARLAERMAALAREHGIPPPVHAGAPPGEPPTAEERVLPGAVSGDAAC